MADGFQALSQAWCLLEEFGRTSITRRKYNLVGSLEGRMFGPARPDANLSLITSCSLPLTALSSPNLTDHANEGYLLQEPKCVLKVQGHSTSPAENLGLAFPRTRTSSTLRTYELAKRKERDGESTFVGEFISPHCFQQSAFGLSCPYDQFLMILHVPCNIWVPSGPHQQSFLCVDQDPFFRALGSCCRRHTYCGFCVSARGAYTTTTPTLTRPPNALHASPCISAFCSLPRCRCSMITLRIQDIEGIGFETCQPQVKDEETRSGR